MSEPSRFGLLCKKALEGGTGYMLEVYDGASVTFMGKFRASQIKNIRSVFYNSGAIE